MGSALTALFIEYMAMQVDPAHTFDNSLATTTQEKLLPRTEWLLFRLQNKLSRKLDPQRCVANLGEGFGGKAESSEFVKTFFCRDCI